jgi:hypothetical protein
MIIYPYRDAIEALQEIVGENKEAGPLEKSKLADACRDYLDWLGEDEDEEEYDD